jgi:hypothetical protein
MSAQDNLPQASWGHDASGAPIVVLQSPQASDEQNRRAQARSAALLWMGALLGGMAIASLFMFVNWWGARDAVKANTDMKIELANAKRDVQDAQKQLKSVQTDTAAQVNVLREEIARLNRENDFIVRTNATKRQAKPNTATRSAVVVSQPYPPSSDPRADTRRK